LKIIISHDIDYITFTEHLRDLTIPKYLVRNCIEYLMGFISTYEFVERYRNLIQNKLQNTIELLTFNRSANIPATVFIAVNRGRNGLNYSLESAAHWIKKVQQLGFDTGVHGISYKDFGQINKEKRCFESIINNSVHGVRIHYVKTDEQTFNSLEKAGYLFDSTDVGYLKKPYKIGKMWEFPINLMDSFLINNGRPWQSVTLNQAKTKTRYLIDEAVRCGLPYYNILFHDNHFCDAFLTWKRWYFWLTEYFNNNKFEFISYRQAVAELEHKRTIL
jgi:hypothetical protein